MDKVFIFVEGSNDMRFIENIIQPFFIDKKLINIFPIPYQQKKKKNIKKTISTYLAHNHNFIFLSDLDSDFYHCITSRKEKRQQEYSTLPLENIVIVKDEIESWYLAGIEDSINEIYDINIPENTENISKEDFEKILENSNVDSKIAFFNEIPKYYNIDLAIKRNNSLKYFIDKINLICS